MEVNKLAVDNQYVLNFCAKTIARNRGISSEGWRFPIVDRLIGIENASLYNKITFVYFDKNSSAKNVSLIGNITGNQRRISMTRVKFQNKPTRYFSVSLKVLKSQYFYYRYLVDGESRLDSINPQKHISDNQMEWSRCFTENYSVPISFNRWERKLLQRLVAYILPFQTAEFRNFINKHSGLFDEHVKSKLSENYFDVGVVNFIDKLVAKEERHHLIDYQICLKQIDHVLRKNYPYEEPFTMDIYEYRKLFDQLENKHIHVPNWDYQKYNDPDYFCKVLRRHIITGAFSHPKYGGNTQAMGWRFLSDLISDKKTEKSFFEWQKSHEKPLGDNEEYIA